MVLTLIAADTQRPWPSHATTEGRPVASTVAIVNGVPLKSDRLDAAVAALLPLESFHRNIAPARLAELRKKALAQIVDEELQFQDATAHRKTEVLPPCHRQAVHHVDEHPQEQTRDDGEDRLHREWSDELIRRSRRRRGVMRGSGAD